MRLATLALTLAAPLLADTGILIPAGKEQPDPAVFSLDEMTIDVRIDNGQARVSIRQIFANHTGSAQEGVYHFALNSGAIISDFAVWDELTRIPGVILERKRADEIYNRARAQAIDPGLLQMGERDASDARHGNAFTVKIVPIPAYGTKRIEIEYHEPVAVENFESALAVALRADVYRQQTAGRLSVTFELSSDHAIRDFSGPSAYPLQIRERTPSRVRGEFSGTNVPLTADFVARYRLDSTQADQLRITTHREGGEGFFGASVLLADPAAAQTGKAAPARTVIALFDNSLSMQWEKLERSFAANEQLLRGLRPQDEFNLLLFNSEVRVFEPAPVPAIAANVERALAFIRNSRIRGGTDLQGGLRAALAQAALGKGAETYIVLMTDGGATEGALSTSRLIAWFEAERSKLPEVRRPRTCVFAVGDDARVGTLRMLTARGGGVLEWVRSTEPIEFKLAAFLSKIVREPMKELALAAAPTVNTGLVYPLEDVRYPGSRASWVGQYYAAGQTAFTVTGSRNGQPVRITATSVLPAASDAHPVLPRAWAKARVDALVEKIEREGEDRASVDEIIKLSKKYKFVTPYTSFLAAPRSLLRPRVIRPGDPILRVHADESIVSVTAVFSFGLIKPLRFLAGEKVWQTRFLAPVDLADGTYPVRLVLRDRGGNVYRESKSFVILSKPPVLRVRLGETRVKAGATVRVSALASASARTITARLYGAAPVKLRWSEGDKASVGELAVPAHLVAGKYNVTVIAEDMAHNIGTQEAALEVW